MATLSTLATVDRDSIPPQLRSRLESVVDVRWSDRPELGAGTELLITDNADLGAGTLAGWPSLRGIVTTGTAVDYVDLDYCRGHGIVVCNTPDYTGSSVAEHALALALASARHLATLDSITRSVDRAVPPMGIELSGRTAGVIGLGHIGSRLATLLHGLGLQVVFVNRNPRRHDHARRVDLGELLAAADLVFLTLPLTPESHHLLDAAAFARMRPTARVINVSADELIDPQALAGALRDGRIAGAALDVIASAQPYVDLPHTILTPSCGWYTQECVYRRAETWIGSVEAFAAGNPRHVVP